MSCCGGNCACGSACKCGSGCGGGNKEELKWFPPSHEVFKYLEPLLIALVAIKCTANRDDPFEAYTVNMWCFGVAKCFYCLAIGIVTQMQTLTEKYFRLFDHVVLFSGTFSSISLASVLFPRQFIFVVLAVLSILLAQNVIKRGYYWVCNGVTNVILVIKSWSSRPDPAEQPDPPPPIEGENDIEANQASTL